MRPDEHKKKKSAQYQKKHVASITKGDKNESGKGSSKGRKSGLAKAEKVSQTSRPNAAKTIHSSTSESEDDQVSDSTRKSFRRREIASNWARYDLPPAEADDNVSTPKGQDFGKLLHSAAISGGALSHFRFKDEEGWEEERGETAGFATQALVLDCADLATSLGCLPLYTQLRLDPDIFSPVEVSSMDKTAEQNRQLTGLPATGQLESHSGQQTKSHKLTATPVTSTNAVKPGKLESLSPSKTSLISNSNEDNIQSERKPDDSLQKTTVLKAGILDADLDSLLEAEDKEEKAFDNSVKTNTIQGVPKVSVDVTEQDLDDLLAAEPPSSLSSMPAASQIKESNTITESAELEDWLDSVLDD